jgi:hypothetical protein
MKTNITKMAMTLLLGATFSIVTVSQVSHAAEPSMEQIHQIKKEKDQQALAQLLNLKAQLVDMQLDLQQAQSGFAYSTTKWIRNISMAVAGLAGVMTYTDLKFGGTNRNFLAYGFVSIGAGLVASLGELGVVLTNDQVEALDQKIGEIKIKIEIVEAQLKRQN